MTGPESSSPTVLRRFGGGLAVCRTQPEHALQLEELQRVVFPTLAPDERFEARHYLHHLELFPEGQLCVVDRQPPSVLRPAAPPDRLGMGQPPSADGDRVVGMTTTIPRDFDFDHPAHTFADVIQGGWLGSRPPTGRWLYGADLGVHPEYRGRGIARALYAARQELVRRLGLLGQLTVGMPSGYGELKHELTAEQYYAELVAGRRRDPTISVQLRIGFQPCGLIPDYIHDPVCDGYGVVLVLPADREVRYPP